MDTVQCDVCTTVFTDCFSAVSNQAYGCASDLVVKEDVTCILSNYGSCFDTSRFIVSKQSPFYQKKGTICDHCITQLVEKKEAVKDENFDFWAGLPQTKPYYDESITGVVIDSLFPEAIGKTIQEARILYEQRNKHKMD